MTKEQQAALTPDAVLKDLVDGKNAFSQEQQLKETIANRLKTAPGQFQSSCFKLFRQSCTS